ncbi:unnamed protein product [Ascophyllum nodosum]
MLPGNREEAGKGRAGGLRRPRTYGSTNSVERRSDRLVTPCVGDAWAEDASVQSSVRQPIPERGSSSMLWRILGASGVLGLFALSISVASSRQQMETSRDRTSSGVATTGLQINSKAPSPRLLHASYPQMETPSSISVTAKNEYGRYERASLALYGLEMVVEPHRETTLEVVGAASPRESLFRWRVDEIDDAGAPLAGADPELDAWGGAETTVTLTKAGGVFLLKVQEQENRPGGALLSEGTVKLSCRYVRREIRDLTENDREEFLEALEVYYTVGTEEGRAKYGDDFFDYRRLALFHNAPLDHLRYHAGLQFLTSHAAFGLTMERSLQAVNPRVSLPFWDYMIDATELGVEWHKSAVFDVDMFGPAMGSPDNNYQLTEGRFGTISSIYDPDDALADSRIGTNHNAYGYVSPTYNYQDPPLITRASSFCGLQPHAMFATEDVLFECFESQHTLSGWESCMENKVHGDIHGLLGGAFKCNVDMQKFHEENLEYSPGLLTFLLEFLTVNKWPSNTFMAGYNDCDADCTRGQAAPCGCACRLDAFSLSDDEVYSLTSDFLEAAKSRYGGDRYVSYDEASARPWGLQQNGIRLDDKASLLLLRYVVKIGCEPGAVGNMCGGASPMDPIFWVLHPIFEKALHVLWMSPRFRDAYSFEWEDGLSNGSRLSDFLPFTESALGAGQGTEFLTNDDIMHVLHASNPRLPYVFEKFSKWGVTDDWDFCPECLVDAAIDDEEST